MARDISKQTSHITRIETLQMTLSFPPYRKQRTDCQHPLLTRGATGVSTHAQSEQHRLTLLIPGKGEIRQASMKSKDLKTDVGVSTFDDSRLNRDDEV